MTLQPGCRQGEEMSMMRDISGISDREAYHPLIISTPGSGESGSSIPYRRSLYLFAFFQTVWISIGTLYFDPYMKDPGFSFKPYIYIPLVCLIFGSAILVAMTLQMLLTDFFRQFNYSEKFAFFLVHWVFFFLPTMLLRRFNMSLSILCMDFFILLCLVMPVHFQRLYASNIFLLTMILIKVPQTPSLWVVVGFILVSISMCLDYFYFKVYSYGEMRFLGFWEFLKIGIRYIIPPLVFAGLVYMFLPPLTPKMTFRGGISLSMPSQDVVLTPQYFSRLVFEGVLVAILLMVSIALLNWLQRRLRGKKPPPAIPFKGIIRKIQKFFEEKIIQPQKEKSLSPRDRIILEYNRFCEEMGRIGFGREVFQTPDEYSLILHPKTDRKETLQTITQTFDHVMYGNHDIDETDEQSFNQSLKSILHGFKERYSS
jgi:hypothetical protein